MDVRREIVAQLNAAYVEQTRRLDVPGPGGSDRQLLTHTGLARSVAAPPSRRPKGGPLQTRLCALM